MLFRGFAERHPGSTNHRLRSQEQGAVLVLFALCAVVVLLFVAFGVDIARLGAAGQRQSRTAELAALYAVEAYMGTTGDADTKLAAAIEQAERVAGFQSNRLMTGMPNIDQVVAGELREETSNHGSGEAGTIEPGTYYFARPGDCTGLEGECPCGLEEFVECFRPHDPAVDPPGDPTSPPITSFRVRLKTKENGVEMLFARAAGIESFHLDSEAIATVIPRHAVFVVDMSPSVTGETHTIPSAASDLETGGVEWSENAFQLKNASDCDATPFSAANPEDPDDYPGSYPAYPVPTGGCQYPGAGDQIIPILERLVWRGEWIDDAGPWIYGMPMCRGADTDFAGNHYRDDYVARKIDTLGTGDDDSDDTCFFVEKKNILNSGGTYPGPQPLNRIIQGIHTAMEIMQTFTIPGDTVSVIGIDRDLWETRYFPPVSVGEPGFDELFALTDTSDLSDATLEDRIRRGLFARASGTDIPEALLNAYEVLSQQPLAEAADNFVILFTDGLPNCAHFDGPSCPGCGPAENGNPDTFVFPTFNPAQAFLHMDGEDMHMGVDTSTRNLDCPNIDDSALPLQPDFDPASWNLFPSPEGAFVKYADELGYRKSVAEVVTMAGAPNPPLSLISEFPSYASANIKIHTFLFGDYVQPHILLRKGVNAIGCLSTADAVFYQQPVTAQSGAGTGSFFNQSKATPFIEPNYIFQHRVSGPTKGRFFPIRPACDPGDVGAASVSECGANSKAYLDGLCEDGSDDGNPETFDIVNINVNDVVVDGRVICDTQCRDAQQQINDGIFELYRDNPIMLVRPGAPPSIPPSDDE